jgi:hypothetical protein
MLIITGFTLMMTVLFVKSESEIKLAVDLINAAKDGIKVTNEILEKTQPGYMCNVNADCYPINIFENLCCIKNGLLGECCNMFSYISLRPLVKFLFHEINTIYMRLYNKVFF